MVFFAIIQMVGVSIMLAPAHSYILRLVELRAREHLKLSSKESSAGPTSATAVTQLFAIFAFVLVNMITFGSVWPRQFNDPGLTLFNRAVFLPVCWVCLNQAFKFFLDLQRWFASINGPWQIEG